MNYRKLGKSDLKISEISFGCMSLENDDAQAERLIHQAIDLGVNFFDTADLYDRGQNEILIGKALKEHRKKIVLATKVGNQWRKDGSGWDWNPSKDYILKSVDQSLQRLQTDYIDLYQLHGGTIDDPIDETIEAFEILQQQGKIRYYGISSIRPNVIKEYIKRSTIVSVMMQYSLLDRRPEEECLDLLYQNNIGVLCRGVLAKGLLAGKPAKDYLEHSMFDIDKAITVVEKLSKNHRSMCQTSIQYVLAHPATSSAVLGMRTQKQLKECFETKSTKALSSQEYEVLKASVSTYFYKQHR